MPFGFGHKRKVCPSGVATQLQPALRSGTCSASGVVKALANAEFRFKADSYHDDEPSAVAEKDSAEAPPRSSGWHKTPRDTTPTAVAVGRTTLANARFNEAEGVGNIGWFFGNWGKRTQHAAGAVQNERRMRY